jgi:uncharacterized protein with HEPN domain
MNQEYRIKDALRSIRKAVAAIEDFTNGMEADEFISDPKTVSAVTYELERISLAAKRVSRLARREQSQLPQQFPWRNTIAIERWLMSYIHSVNPDIIWQTVQQDLPLIKDGLRSLLDDPEDKPRASELTRVKLVSPSSTKLTSTYLDVSLVPYLKAIARIQCIINEIEGNTHKEVIIRSITQRNPINVSLEGASKAIQEVKDSVVPWRRQHQKELANLQEQEKKVEIGIKEAEILERQAKAAKDQAEAGKISAEAAKQHEETEKLRLENEKLKIELHRAQIQLALEVLAQVAPNLSETERIAYVVKLLPPLNVVVSSDLEIDSEERR